MQIWVRIYVFFDSYDGAFQSTAKGVTIKPSMGLTVHASEESAKAAAKKYGGFALVTETSALKEILEPPSEISIDGVKHVLIDGCLIDGDTEGVKCVRPNAGLWFDYSALPHTDEPVEGCQDKYPVFTDEANTFIKNLETALGAFTHIA